MALDRLKKAEKLGRAGPRGFYDAASVAMAGYLADRFNLPEIAVTRDNLERTLSEKSVAAGAIQEALSCLQECDFGRFVSASESPEKMRALAARIQKTIAALEQV